MDGVETFSMRSKDRILDVESILNIKDSEFLNYSLPQRVEVVRKYCRDGESLARLVEVLEKKERLRAKPRDQP
jgi:hypothetical protein